ncbi:hypothetical protein [Streptomyces sp. NPDC090994]|uniref:hypothetical protein n=1 Tax=Streptomyces sp. NPDC090994 TaxID=3365969 RepID=UPI00383027AF
MIRHGRGGTLFLRGVIYGPMGAFLPELFPVRLRYSGAGLAYSLGGVAGGAVAPVVVTRPQSACGSASVGWYVSAMAVVPPACPLLLPETRERSTAKPDPRLGTPTGEPVAAVDGTVPTTWDGPHGEVDGRA